MGKIQETRVLKSEPQYRDPRYAIEAMSKQDLTRLTDQRSDPIWMSRHLSVGPQISLDAGLLFGTRAIILLI